MVFVVVMVFFIDLSNVSGPSVDMSTSRFIQEIWEIWGGFGTQIDPRQFPYIKDPLGSNNL